MFATIFLPNFYLQAALRHQTAVDGTVLTAVRATATSSATWSESSGEKHAWPYSRGETATGATDSPQNESSRQAEKTSMLPPVALIEEREKKPVIIQLNHAAEDAGVSKGMTPSQALARCLFLLIKTRSRSQEKSIQEIILHYAFSLSPFVEATRADVCTVQFTHDRELLSKVSRVIDQLAACDITAQAGLAPTPDISFLAAHLARPVLQIKDPKEFLAPLSIDILAIPFES
jgi:nucleotidyltransferase/DNA polymerase involved in DNA repair